MVVSYQNSIPGQLNGTTVCSAITTTAAAASEDLVSVAVIGNGHNDGRFLPIQRTVVRSLTPLTAFTVLIMVAATLMISSYGEGSPESAVNYLRSSQLQQQAVVMLQPASATSTTTEADPPVLSNYGKEHSNMPRPDFNGEGRYDWQKCKASNDPDCWKNEGERVGSYWHNFGLSVKTFWINLRQRIHDFFVKNNAITDDEESPQEGTSTTKKTKHSNKKTTIAPETGTVTPAGTAESEVDANV
jgi:hypothetical protein